MSESDIQREIRDQYGSNGAEMMDVLDRMARASRLPLLRKLIELETMSLRRHIDELAAVLPLEDRP
jgi:hypothetical protein